MHSTDQVLLAPIAHDAPCGKNLEHLHEFFALEDSLQGTPEKQFGEVIIPAEPPAWGHVHDQALKLLGQTKDLRLLVALIRSNVATKGLHTLVDGLAVLDFWLKTYWDTVYPELEDGDATFRLNALSALASMECLLAEIRQASFLPTKGLGPLKVLEIELYLNKKGNLIQSDSDFRPYIDASPEATAKYAAMLDRSLELIGSITNTITEHAHQESLILAPLTGLLKRLRQLLPDNQLLVANDSSLNLAQPQSTIPIHPSGPLERTPIASRADVERLLDEICMYLQKHEPTNPAPLLLKRARKLMGMDFLEIIRDMSPDSISQIETIAGSHR